MKGIGNRQKKVVAPRRPPPQKGRKPPSPQARRKPPSPPPRRPRRGPPPSTPSAPMGVRESYDSAARAYAEQLSSELEHKPLDRHLLNRFAEAARGLGVVADLGCGPGHIAGYLHAQGVETVGIDLSPEMIRVARKRQRGLDFRVGDVRRLDLPDGRLAGVLAFYSIVHFDAGELAGVFGEIRRVLAPGGLLLVSFHVGLEVVHVDELFGAPVNLDFRFHSPREVVEALRAARFQVLEHVEREPYEGAEYPSRRCYLLARAQPPRKAGE
jgi:SAM-dependent methyltransferase